jgi:hypothetical protein
MACQSAWAAARTKNTCLSAQFKRLSARRGRKCAIIAVAHSILVIGYHLQRKRCAYADLCGHYFDRLHAEGLKRYLVKRLESLGHSVHSPAAHRLSQVFSREKAGPPRLFELFSRDPPSRSLFVVANIFFLYQFDVYVTLIPALSSPNG